MLLTRKFNANSPWQKLRSSTRRINSAAKGFRFQEKRDFGQSFRLSAARRLIKRWIEFPPRGRAN